MWRIEEGRRWEDLSLAPSHETPADAAATGSCKSEAGSSLPTPSKHNTTPKTQAAIKEVISPQPAHHQNYTQRRSLHFLQSAPTRMLYIPALLAPSAKYQNTSDISYICTFEDLCDTKLLLLLGLLLVLALVVVGPTMLVLLLMFVGGKTKRTASKQCRAVRAGHIALRSHIFPPSLPVGLVRQPLWKFSAHPWLLLLQGTLCLMPNSATLDNDKIKSRQQ